MNEEERLGKEESENLQKNEKKKKIDTKITMT